MWWAVVAIGRGESETCLFIKGNHLSFFVSTSVDFTVFRFSVTKNQK